MRFPQSGWEEEGRGERDRGDGPEALESEKGEEKWVNNVFHIQMHD